MKLISAIAAIVLATATLASAAPRQRAVSKAGKATHAKAVKTAKPANRKVAQAKYRKTPTVQRAAIKTQKPEAKAEIKNAIHDLKAEEQELKRLKGDLKAAQKVGDSRRVARDRRAMYQLEAEVRADKADRKDQQRVARNVTKKSRIPFWGWWRRS